MASFFGPRRQRTQQLLRLVASSLRFLATEFVGEGVDGGRDTQNQQRFCPSCASLRGGRWKNQSNKASSSFVSFELYVAAEMMYDQALKQRNQGQQGQGQGHASYAYQQQAPMNPYAAVPASTAQHGYSAPLPSLSSRSAPPTPKNAFNSTGSFSGFLKQFDIYTKVEDNYKVQTSSGATSTFAITSPIELAVMALLLCLYSRPRLLWGYYLFSPKKRR